MKTQVLYWVNSSDPYINKVHISNNIFLVIPNGLAIDLEVEIVSVDLVQVVVISLDVEDHLALLLPPNPLPHFTFRGIGNVPM